MAALDFGVLLLATWRIGSLLYYERGPYAILQRLRERLGVAHDEDGDPVGWPDTELGYLARCLDCGSVWVGAGLVGLYLLAPGLAVILALPFALSAGAIVIEVAMGVAKAVKAWGWK